MSVILIFIDGLGIGLREPSNPLTELDGDGEFLSVFRNEEPSLPFDGHLAVTDPRLGVEGRPQSASGQTTILTGVNAAALLGHHKQGFPNETLRQVLREHSIFLKLKDRGSDSAVFANAYSPQFFEKRPRWVSATTVAVEAAQMSFRTFEDVVNGGALFHDFTNQVLIERGFELPQLTPMHAAKVLASLAEGRSFTLYEYFLTDKAGHDQDSKTAVRLLRTLAAFVLELLRHVDLRETTVILTSDHGNVESLSTRNHTLNDVPTLVWGAHARETAMRIKSLVDLAPTILDLVFNSPDR
jgi:hypothetical protein